MRPFASPIPENTRRDKRRANVYDPIPTIPTRTTRSQSTTREPTFAQQSSVTPTRSNSNFSDENIDPTSVYLKNRQMASQESTQSSSKAGSSLTLGDFDDLFSKITDKFVQSLDNISRGEPAAATAANINDTSTAAFLRLWPAVWTPLSLKCSQDVLSIRLDAIWELSSSNFNLTKRNILLLLDEESQSAVTTAHESILKKENVSKSEWINCILSIHGPKLHSIYKHIIDPSPFRDESWLQFAKRLAVSTNRCEAHPCPELALRRLQCVVRSYAEFSAIQKSDSWDDAIEEMHKICVDHFSTTGQELRPRSRQQPSPSTTTTPPTSTTTTPNYNNNNNNNCSFCGKKGHSADRCWKKDPTLRDRFRKNVNATQINDSQRSTSSRHQQNSQSPNYSPSTPSSHSTQPASASIHPPPIRLSIEYVNQ